MTGDTKDTGPINTGGGAFVGGGVNTGGGTFVGRDQVITGSSGIVTGQQGVTLEQFRALLTDIRNLIPQAGLDERKARLIEGDVATVEEETQQVKPDKSIIQSKLESTTQVLKAAGNLTEEGKKLLPLLSQGVLWVARLFT